MAVVQKQTNGLAHPDWDRLVGSAHPPQRKNRPVIQVQDVDKVYSNGTIALKGVSLDIHQGEFVSLLGPSGCGKSTLLRIMAGLGEKTGGNVHWWEQDYHAVGDSGRKLAFVFQNATLMPWARVRKNVRLPLDLERMGRETAEQQIDQALEMVGLEKFGQSFPRELSGGMQMRASIARALVTQPNLLLMDEPFGALDEMTRNKLNDDILRLWQEKGWTIVFVTHSIYEAVYLSSRVVVMAARPGRVVDDISIDEPFPRSSDFRVSASFTQYCRRVSKALEQASGMGEESVQ